ncbi:hypothetical protein [Paraglaciecola arctica]|uniref:Uncharacterized protein n=1 Tax=Paraglaciecola arctica BSs20135 TaxID=493475 RepID=K6YL66_9ALTE|nr:hypothetical protein [Paraglaciecola arctica]GAC18897.1 hypothetical protein GARC_1930 [Paraglaciecola arctica BSs20135]
MKKKEQSAKGAVDNNFNVVVKDIYWHFHDFKTKSSKSPDIGKIKTSFNKEASNKPDFYKQHVTSYSGSTFIMGSIDLFLTNSKSALKDAVKAEVEDRIINE